MQQAWLNEIEDTVARFRMGEAEVARAFFATPRPLEQYVGWLRVQVTRELRNLREISEDLLKDLVDRVDETATREELVERLMEDYQEARHYGMLAYLLEGISGEDVRWKQLNAQRSTAGWFATVLREGARRRELAAVSPLHRAAAAFTGGGAGSLFYGFIGLSGGAYEELLSEAAKIVLSDELAHGASEGRDLLYPLVQSADDAAVALDVIREMSTIRVYGRNEQFGHPLPEERLEEIVRGDIEPATFEKLAEACREPVTDHDWFARYHGAAKPLSSASIAA